MLVNCLTHRPVRFALGLFEEVIQVTFPRSSRMGTYSMLLLRERFSSRLGDDCEARIMLLRSDSSSPFAFFLLGFFLGLTFFLEPLEPLIPFERAPPDPFELRVLVDDREPCDPSSERQHLVTIIP